MFNDRRCSLTPKCSLKPRQICGKSWGRRLLCTAGFFHLSSFSWSGGGRRSLTYVSRRGTDTDNRRLGCWQPRCFFRSPSNFILDSATLPETNLDKGSSRSSCGDAGGLSIPETVSKGTIVPLSRGITPTEERSAGSGAVSRPERV